MSCLISVSSIKRWAQSRLVYLRPGMPLCCLFSVSFTKGMSRLISVSFIKHGPVYEHWCLRTSGIVYEHVCLRTPGLVYEHTCLRTLGSVYEHGCLRTPGFVYEHAVFTNRVPRLVYKQCVLANAGLVNASANEHSRGSV